MSGSERFKCVSSRVEGHGFTADMWVLLQRKNGGVE